MIPDRQLKKARLSVDTEFALNWELCVRCPPYFAVSLNPSLLTKAPRLYPCHVFPPRDIFLSLSSQKQHTYVHTQNTFETGVTTKHTRKHQSVAPSRGSIYIALLLKYGNFFLKKSS